MDLKVQRTQECLAEMRDHYRNTKVPANVLIVWGRTGAGKSSVLEDLTGLDGYSQQSVNPVTQEADIAKAVIEDKVYFVMDTPGFDAENENTYFEIMRGIESIRHFARIAGVLYLTCINQLRFEDFDRKLVRFIYAFSGEGFIPRVTFVTTFWTVAGNQQREIFNRQLGLLQREWEQGVHSQHLSLYQHGREYNAHGQGTGHIINWFENRNQIAQHAKEMIDRNYGPATSEYHPPKIVRELDANIPISETEAAQVLGMSSASTNESTSHRQSREQPGQQRQTPTPPGASGNSQPGSEVPQDPPASGFSAFLDGFFRFVGNTLGNTTWEVNFGGPGPGPASSMRTELFGFQSPVDLMDELGFDSSKEGRKRYAAAHGIGGTPFSAEWGDAMLRDLKRRYS